MPNDNLTDPHHVYDGCAYTVVRIRDGEPGAFERLRGEDIRPLLDAIPEGAVHESDR